LARKPYIFGKGGGKSGLADFYDPPAEALTLSKRLALDAARRKGHSESFWDRIKSGGGHVLHPIEWTFDKILRPAYGISEATYRMAKYETQHGGDLSLLDLLHHKGGSSLGRELATGAHGFVGGFTGKQKHGMGQTLEAAGYLKGHRRLRGLAGFGLDVLTDPVTAVSGGSTIFASSSKHAFAIAGGRRALSEAGGRRLLENPERLDEVIAKTRKDIEHLSGEPFKKDYRYRRALAKMNLREYEAAKDGKLVDDVFQSRKNIIAAAAQAEEKRVERFVPHYKFMGKKITPDVLGKTTKIGGRSFTEGRKVAPALPKFDNFIAREGIGSGTARRFREAMIRPASESPEVHAMNITAKHVAERITHEQYRFANERLAGVAEKITPERQREILHHFEKPPKKVKAVIQRAGVYQLNPRYIERLVKDGKITEKEAEFADSYQQVMEHMFHNEKAFGAVTRHFSENGRMYVPHLMDKNGVALNDEMRLLTTKAGFERARSDRDFSLKELVDMAEKGDLPRGVVKNPYELLVSRVRASGRRQGELGHLDAMASVAGVRKRIVDTKKLDKHRGKMTALMMEYGIKAQEHTQAAAQAIKEHEDAIAAAEARIRSIKFGKKSRTKAANLRRAEKHLEGLRKRGPFLADAADRFGELEKLDKELKQLTKVEKGIIKGKANPEYRESMHTLSDFKDEFGHPLALPDELGQAAQKVRKVIEGDDAAIKGFEAGYRQLLSRWKVLVTSINPSYRMRNSQTDLWNWWLKPGVNTYHMTKNLGKATKFLISMKNIERKIAKHGMTDDLRKTLHDFQDMYDNGLLSGLYQGDVQTAAEMLRLGHSKKALIKKARLLKFGEKAAQDMNRNGENWVRIAHYFWAKEDKGLSPVEASLSVKSAHFDYEDLTPFEQRRLKAVAPFYTWSRKNIPYQIKSLIQSPGKYAAFPKAAMEADYAAGDGEGDIIPDYISDAWGIPVGGGNYVLPQLGVSDLQAFDSTQGAKARGVGLLTPAAKLPIEWLTNKNLFTGGPIASDTHKRNPTTPFGAALLGLLPGADVGTTSRIGPGGERLYGPGANPYLLHALGYLGPTANLLLRKSGGIGAAQTPISPMWSYGAGISIQHVDQAQQRLLERIQFSEDAKKQLQSMRDEGLIPQAKPKRGRSQARMDDLYARERGRR
jgi:hypothetical protein